MDDQRAEKLRNDVTDAARKLKTVHATGAVSLETSSDDFSCGGTSCTFKATLGADIPETMWSAEKVKVGFKGIAKAESAGKEDCVGSVKVKQGETKKASCKVTFNLAAGTSSNVSGKWRTRDLVTFKPNTSDIKGTVEDDMKDLVD